MFILQSRLKIGFMLKTVEKMADRGTLVRLKEIRPSTGNDVTIQIFNYKIFNWIIHLYRSFFGLTYVFYLKPISLIVFKWQHGKEWQKIAPILGTTNYLSYYYYVCMSYKTTRVSNVLLVNDLTRFGRFLQQLWTLVHHSWQQKLWKSI